MKNLLWMGSNADPRKTVPGWAVPDRPTDAEAEPRALGSGVAVAGCRPYGNHASFIKLRAGHAGT